MKANYKLSKQAKRPRGNLVNCKARRRVSSLNAKLKVVTRSNIDQQYLYKNIQSAHLSVLALCSTGVGFPLTIASPRIIEHQNSTLFKMVRPFTHFERCTSTIGICSIIAMKPYPRNFLVMQPITSSCARALMKKVIVVASGRDMCPRDAE